jgi:hypothetical protein
MGATKARAAFNANGRLAQRTSQLLLVETSGDFWVIGSELAAFCVWDMVLSLL